MTPRTRRAALLFTLLGTASCTTTVGAPPGSAVAARPTFVARTSGPAIEARASTTAIELTPPHEEASEWRIAIGVGWLAREGDRVSTGAADARCGERGCAVARGAGVTERWTDGTHGLEHVVEVAHRAPGTGVLRIGVDVSGAEVISTASRTAVVLQPRGSSESLRYAGLDVRDAHGERLEAWLEARSGGLDIVVDDATATYPLVIDPYVARTVQSLTASGWAVDVSGTTLVVGATYDELPGVSHPGTARVYVPSGGVMVEQAMLSAADPTPESFFGIAVAISGDTIAVGCTHGWDDAGNPDVGAVYVFVRSGTTWTQQAKLFESSGGPLKSYGYSLSLQGDTLAVGARWDDHDGLTNAGAVYVYTRSGTTWTLQQKVTASDADNYDTFGFAVALSNDTLAVGSYLRDHVPVPDQGAVYVYTRTGATWTEQAVLEGVARGVSEELGYSVALESDTLIAGAPGYDSGGITDRGGARVFTRSGPTWAESALILAPDSVTGDRMGDSVALESGTVLVGASQADLGALVDAGAFYVLTGSGATWTERTKGQPTTPAAGALFGYALDHHLGTAFVGAPSPGVGTPQTYVMRLGLDDGDACTASDECASGACVDAVCCNTPCGGGVAADCQACSVAAGAALNGTCAPLAAATVCRPAAGVCDAVERCDGTAPACPADAPRPDGAACADGLGCNGEETCASGACVAATPIACNDSSVCTTDACVEPGACSFVAIADCCVADAECMDTDVCTADRCIASACAHAPVTGCCHADTECDDGDACTVDHCTADVCVRTVSPACVDAGPAPTDAGVPTPDAGPAGTDAGPASDDAGPADSDAGSAGSDAGTMRRDAGIASPDGSVRDAAGADASAAPPPGDDGGCGCRTAGAHGHAGALLGLLALLALVPLARRRRMRRTSR